MVRLGVLFAVGVIVTPIAALIARSHGGDVVQSGNLPGAAVALEPAAETTTAPLLPPVGPALGTVPATVPPAGTLPATIAPPTTAPKPTTTAAPAPAEQSAAAAGPAAKITKVAAAQPTAAPTTPAPKPAAATTAPPTTPPPKRSWGEGEVVQIIRSVFPDDLEEHALYIANRESNFDPYARNFCCIGVFQIYGSVHEKLINGLGFTVDQLTDPLVNCVVAYAIYQRSGWAPWGG